MNPTWRGGRAMMPVAASGSATRKIARPGCSHDADILKSAHDHVPALSQNPGVRARALSALPHPPAGCVPEEASCSAEAADASLAQAGDGPGSSDTAMPGLRTSGSARRALVQLVQVAIEPRPVAALTRNLAITTALLTKLPPCRAGTANREQNARRCR